MRLIDAEAFVQTEIDRCGCIPFVGTCTMNNEFLPVRVMKAPTIEAKPVVHARWVTDFDFDPEEEQELYFYFCSKCKNGLFGNKEDFKYCPYCGAQMDEKGER